MQTEDDEGRHVRFIIRTQVVVTQEAWDSPRRYREFTQLRKRLLRLGVHVPTLAASTADGDAGVDNHEKSVPEMTLAPDLPKKTWRYNKFDKGHLSTRRAALEAYLQGVVKVRDEICRALLVKRLFRLHGYGGSKAPSERNFDQPSNLLCDGSRHLNWCMSPSRRKGAHKLTDFLVPQNHEAKYS